jgi:hypothetical protein
MESSGIHEFQKYSHIRFNVAMTFQSWKEPPIDGLDRYRKNCHFREGHQNDPKQDGRSPHLGFDLGMMLSFRAHPGVFITT